MQTQEEDPQEETQEETEETQEEETQAVEVEDTPPPPSPLDLINQRLDGIEKLIKNANKKPTQKKEETPDNGTKKENTTGPTEQQPAAPTEPTRRRGLRLKKRK